MTTVGNAIIMNNQKLPRLTNAADYYRWREESTDVFLQKASKIWRISFASSMKWRLEELETEFNSLKQEKASIDGFVGKIKELSEQLHLGGVEVTMHKKYTFEIVTEPLDEKAEFDGIVAKLRSKELELGLNSHGLTQKTRQGMSAFFTQSRPQKPRHQGRFEKKSSGPRPQRRIEDIVCYQHCSVTNGRWIIDSGSTTHICTKAALFTDLKPVSGRVIRSANGAETEADGEGTVHIKVNLEKGKIGIVTLENVLYIPSYAANLISLSRIRGKAEIIMSKNSTVAKINVPWLNRG
ncbi:uncharacterized protein PSFLO_06121 [Pseudozyma flocculosa]|uniref:Retrovirus-related Pol polyprotein from transposon TNT 1-94-like beta-barrel domain-containing protein n=1 Tax=Pseudozyma flocculosa TaxID=84751 RepID=A0A5C3FBB8_9BASI|nr:uncharacterized protein PSFLO_06121 [Pseudozyma flocculosa]